MERKIGAALISVFYKDGLEPIVRKLHEQRQGPYSLWHHQHLFEQDGNGTLMTDIVHYKLPLGPLGVLAKSLFVGKQLEDIFEYRREVIEEKFG